MTNTSLFINQYISAIQPKAKKSFFCDLSNNLCFPSAKIVFQVPGSNNLALSQFTPWHFSCCVTLLLWNFRLHPPKPFTQKKTIRWNIKSQFYLLPQIPAPPKSLGPNNGLARMYRAHSSLSRPWQSIAYVGSRDNLGKSGVLLTINIQKPMPYKRCTL